MKGVRISMKIVRIEKGEVPEGLEFVNDESAVSQTDETPAPQVLEGTVDVNGGQAKQISQLRLGQRELT